MWYSIVTDKITKGEVKVAFCPTHDMLGNFFTKPLQGNQFVQECVGEEQILMKI